MADHEKGATLGLLAIDRNWFAEHVEANEGPLFARLMFSIYLKWMDGEIISKSAAGQEMGVEHKATVARYVELGKSKGLLQTMKPRSKVLDQRFDMLVLTAPGIAAVEKEAGEVLKDIEAKHKILIGDYEGAKKLRPSWDYSWLRHYTAAMPLTTTADLAYRQEAPEEGKDDKTLEIAAATEVLEIYPNHVPALKKRSDVYIRVGQYDAAIADLEKVVELVPQDAATWANLARIKNETGKHEDALASAERSLQIKWSDYAVMMKQRALEALDRESDALVTLNDAIENSPAGDHFYARAQIHERNGNYSLALADYRAAQTHEFKASVIVWQKEVLDEAVNRLEWLGRNGRDNRGRSGHLADMIEYCSEVLKMAPGHTQTLMRRLECYFELKRFDEALGDLDSVLRADPSNVWLWRRRAGVNIERQDWGVAIDDANRVLKLDPNFIGIKYLRAVALANSGETLKAIADCDDLIDGKWGDGTPFWLRSQLHNTLGHNSKALADAIEAKRLYADEGNRNFEEEIDKAIETLSGSNAGALAAKDRKTPKKRRK